MNPEAAAASIANVAPAVNGEFVRNSVIDPPEFAAASMNGRFSGCGAACLGVQFR